MSSRGLFGRLRLPLGVVAVGWRENTAENPHRHGARVAADFDGTGRLAAERGMCSGDVVRLPGEEQVAEPVRHTGKIAATRKLGNTAGVRINGR